MRIINLTLAARLALALILLYGAAFPCSGLAEGGSGAEVLFIDSPGCTKCAAAERVLEKVGQDISLNITSYYYYSDEGHRIIKQYGSRDVPSIIIGSHEIGRAHV